MIINELVTNIFKYAFPEGKPGTDEDICRIHIDMQHHNNTYTLSVADNGIGLPSGFDWTKASTLGMVLVRMLGTHQLGGRYVLDQMTGTRFSLTFTSKKGNIE
jgi:two-component sensor histidine kinase